MGNKLNYDSKALLNFKFSPKEKGYDPLEVDQVFDNIIKDYEACDSEIKKLSQENVEQKTELEELKKQLEKLSLELSSCKKQLAELKKASTITDDNYKLIKKITNYERVLHRKGVDLKKAYSDPDNC